jgi:hypothetical protein
MGPGEIAMDNTIPITLSHILKVYRLVFRYGLPRKSAINEVARSPRRIDPRSVVSACTRSIGINIAEFDEFIMKKDGSEFRALLLKRFPIQQKFIDNFFVALQAVPEAIDKKELLSPIETLFHDEVEILRNNILLKRIKDQFILWKDRSDIPNDIKEQIRKLTDEIG